MVGGDSDGFADCGDPAGSRPRRTSVTQGGFGVFVEQFAGGNQMARHRVGGGTVQGAQFAADFGCQLPGVNIGRYNGPVVGCAVAVGGTAVRLRRASPSRP